MSRRITLLLAVCIALAGIIVGGRLCRHSTTGPSTRIDDLSVSAVKVLALSPDAAKIEVLVAATRPTHRIVQIVDCHYYSREDTPKVWRDACDEDFNEYVTRVEELQRTQLRLLCWLVDNHGLSEVFQEGLWAEALPGVDNELKWLRDWCGRRPEVIALVARLRREIDDADAHDQDATALRTRLRVAEEYAQWGLISGAVPMLLIARPSVKLLPAEDKECLESYRRVGYSTMEVRDAAIVENLLSRSKCAVITLGAVHDLSEQVRRLGGGRCEYVRVVPKGFAECIDSLGGEKKWPLPRGLLDPWRAQLQNRAP